MFFNTCQISKIPTPDKIFLDKDSFCAYFEQIIQKWTSFCQNYQFSDKNSNFFVHKAVMQKIPLDRFLEFHPKLIQQDKELHAKIKKNFKNLLDDILQDPLPKNSC